MQAKQKIAVVEDDYAIASMYDFKLRYHGYEVNTAPDGEQGLSLAKTFNPDLILLDIMMPIMDGAEMLEKLRHRAVLLPEYAEQKMLRTNRCAGQACRLFPAECKDF